MSDNVSILSLTDLHEIEKRLKNATKGPYRVGRAHTVVADYPVPAIKGSDEVEYYGGYLIGESISPENSEFLAHSWQDIANLIVEVRRLQNLLDKNGVIYEYRCCENKTCKSMYSPNRNDQKYCSSICKNRVQQQKHRAKMKKCRSV